MWGTKCLIHRVGEATEDSGPEYKSLKWKCYKEISKIAQEEEREGERGRGCPWENLVNQKSSEMRGNSLDTVLDGHGTNLRP